MSTTSHRSPRPKLACEIFSDRVIAARASKGSQSLEVYTARDLREDIVTPNLLGVNIHDREGMISTLESALGELEARSRDVVVVLPDAAVRVILLEVENLPDKTDEAQAFIRFRLRKSLPFDVDTAAISFHSWPALEGPVRVLATITPGSILREYETAFEDAGYTAGIVLPSMLAALGLVEGEKPTLVIKMDAATTTVAIIADGQLRLYRNLEHSTTVTGRDLAEAVHPSLVFFEDTYNSRIERVMLGGMVALSGVATSLLEQTGVKPEELTSVAVGEALSGVHLSKSLLSGIAGALLG